LKKAADHFQRIGLVGNAEKSACAASVRAAAKLIQRSGRQVFGDEITTRLARLKCAAIPQVAALAREVDLLLVFGGDGTMLHVARQIAGSNTPMLGVNIGGLGFLTAVPSDKLAEALKLVWRGEFKFEARALIEASGTGRGKKIHAAALNDIVISRGAISRLIALDVSVNGDPITRYRCDGLIVSSPTGSTAYSLSAGGPIISPAAQVFAITPICPHALSNRSVIVSSDATVQVKVLSDQLEIIVAADGQMQAGLGCGDVVTIRRARRPVRLLHLGGWSFFDTVRRKLHWSGSSV
jgi:NAD+ kinase